MAETNEGPPGELTTCIPCGGPVRVTISPRGAPVFTDPDPLPDDATDEYVALFQGGGLSFAIRADVAGRGLSLYRWHHDTCRENRGVPNDPERFQECVQR